MKNFKAISNQASFMLSVICLITLLSLNLFYTPTAHDFILYLIYLALAAFLIGVVGIPFEQKNDKRQIAKSIFSLIVSLLIILILFTVWISPTLLPFGIPNILP